MKALFTILLLFYATINVASRPEVASTCVISIRMFELTRLLPSFEPLLARPNIYSHLKPLGLSLYSS